MPEGTSTLISEGPHMGISDGSPGGIPETFERSLVVMSEESLKRSSRVLKRFDPESSCWILT